jgi:osmotically inducible lipoprotein OsmB
MKTKPNFQPPSATLGKTLTAAVMAAGVLSMASCATRAGTGAAAGAGTGAILGGPPGAVVGAGVGAVGGAAMDETRRRR